MKSTTPEPDLEYSAAEIEAGERLFRREWVFVRSAPILDALPEPDRPEFAFAGRSNVGKSTLINSLVDHRGLARTSNTPGRTQELIFFTAQGAHGYLVDMPGYGYAKAPKEAVASWSKLVRNYLRGRQPLKRVFLLIDARHGVKAEDSKIMSLLDEAAVSYLLVLTKADKVPAAKLPSVIEAVALEASKHAAAYPRIIATSSVSGHGREQLRAEIAKLLAE